MRHCARTILTTFYHMHHYTGDMVQVSYTCKNTQWHGTELILFTFMLLLLYPGAKLTQEELGDLLGKLASVTTTLQEREKAKKKSPEVTFNLPKLPEWLSTRTYLTRDFVIQLPLSSKGGVVEGMALGSMPVAMQEQAILEDLLSAMMGQDGR